MPTHVISVNGELADETGNVVALNIYNTDGSISERRTITLTSLSLGHTKGDFLIAIEDGGGNFGFSSEPDGKAEFEVVVGSAIFRMRNNTGAESNEPQIALEIDPLTPTGKASIEDNRDIPEGLVYKADYSSSFIAESLVSKKYVDNKFPATVVTQDIFIDGVGTLVFVNGFLTEVVV